MLLDLYFKLYECSPELYSKFFEGLYNEQKKQNNDEEDEENMEEDEEDEEDEENMEEDEENVENMEENVDEEKFNLELFHEDLLSKLFNLIENYFIYYGYVKDKDEYIVKLFNLIEGDETKVYEREYKQFLNNMKKFLDLYYDDLVVSRKYIIDHIIKMRDRYNIEPQKNIIGGKKRKYKLKLK